MYSPNTNENVCVRRVQRMHASQFKVVLIRVKSFKNEKFVILEWKLDDEGLFALSAAILNWLAVDFS